MFDLQIDKNKKQKTKNKKLSSMNKSCEKKKQQHIQVCAELAFAKSPSTAWS